MKFTGEVPALYRGITVLQHLSKEGEMSLEKIASITTYPKASLLRMLHTLISLNLVEKDGKSRKFRATARIVRSKHGELSLTARIQHIIENLSSDLSVTVEWYNSQEAGLEINQRATPLNGDIYVKARIGFLRPWNNELDSVALLGYAFDNNAPNVENQENVWIYGSKGKKIPLDSSSAKQLIATTKEKKCMIDSNCNTRGIRRLSVPVLRGEEFIGILSLALVCSPVLDTQIEYLTSRLLLAAGEILT